MSIKNYYISEITDFEDNFEKKYFFEYNLEKKYFLKILIWNDLIRLLMLNKHH